MITTNSGISPGSPAGLPSAAELARLANSLFPDLIRDPGTETALEQSSGALPGTGAVSGGAVPGAEVPGVPAGAASSAPEVVPADPVARPAASGGFDWEHPWSVSSPASGGGEIRSYSPTVVSRQQAAAAGTAPGSASPAAPVPAPGNPWPGGSGTVLVGSRTLESIRSDFPILSEEIGGYPLVWLDNGATTQRPRQVIDRLTYYYEHENSNVHRGAHTLAARSTDAYENARNIVRDFIGASRSEEIVFVRGTTEAINLVANAYVKPLLSPGDEIIVSIMEHHANIVPWQLIAAQTGAVIRVIPCDETGQLILSEYERLFSPRTRFVAVTQVSNVLGTVTQVAELVESAHRHGVRILVDGAQSVAHIPVNVTALDADFFVFSGHKIYAPTGIGVVYGKKELLNAAQPYHGGGNMIADVTFERTIYNDVPNKFEAGTGSIADAVGLGAALEYLTSIGMDSVCRWEHELLQYALKEMSRIPGLTLIGTALNKASVLSFKLAGHEDEEVGRRLNDLGIAVRTGHHCAQPVLRRFGYESSVRPTLALYNSPEDVDRLVRGIRSIA